MSKTLIAEDRTLCFVSKKLSDPHETPSKILRSAFFLPVFTLNKKHDELNISVDKLTLLSNVFCQ